jgi:phage gp36-like protein
MTITNDDLLKEISLDDLTQLSDLEHSGTLNQQVIDDAVADALSFIESFIVIPDDPTPLLRKIAVDLAILELRRKNDLLTGEHKEHLKECEARLSKMARGSMPASLPQQRSGTKRDRSYAFRTSRRRIMPPKERR